MKLMIELPNAFTSNGGIGIGPLSQQMVNALVIIHT
jgi:hypothetical protein